MPCGCLLALLCGPRVAIFFTWLFGWLGPQFATTLWPLLGSLFMPWTTLSYACCMSYFGPPAEAIVPWAIVLVFAVSADVRTYAFLSEPPKKKKTRSQTRPRRQPRYTDFS